MNRRSILTLAAVLGFSSLVRAADEPKTVPLDPKVRAVLVASATFYQSKKTVEGDMASAMTIALSGIKQEMDSSSHLVVRQPNCFALTLQSGMMGGTMISDGKSVWTYVPMMNRYTKTDAPDNLSDLLEPMNLMLVSGGPLSSGIENFFRKDPATLFEDKLTSSRDLGPEKLGGVQTHHVQLVTPPYTKDYWIADGASPALLQVRVVMDMAGPLKNLTPNQRKNLPPNMSKSSTMTMTRTTTYSNWKFDQPVADDAFVFHSPGNAKLVTDFVPQFPHPLLGRMAPDFELKDLDGKSVSLKSLRGKIVVLDFWATWCGPCVATLPAVVKVASSFADKGVVFYGVNLREKSDVIRKFQAAKSLAFPVLLDSDGKVSRLFQASAIPQSVLIDKNGKIAAIHTGYSSSIKEMLTQQLTDLLAGKPLPPEAPPAPAPNELPPPPPPAPPAPTH